PFRRPLDDRLHQRVAHAIILTCWIDCDWPDAADRISLVEEVATHDPSIDLRHDCKYPLVRDQHSESLGGDLRARKIRQEVVLIRDGFERPVTNLANDAGVGATTSAHGNGHFELSF